MAEYRRDGHEAVTNDRIRRQITEGLSGTGPDQVLFANEFGGLDRSGGTKPPGNSRIYLDDGSVETPIDPRARYGR